MFLLYLCHFSFFVSRLSLIMLVNIYILRPNITFYLFPIIHDVFFHGHKTKSIMFGHTHKKILLKILNHLFYQFFFIIKKYFFMCVTKHYFFGPGTILEFLQYNKNFHVNSHTRS